MKGEAPVALTPEQQARVNVALPALTRQATAFVLRFPAFLRDDLVQVALESASRSAVTYDPTHGASFTTYAWGRASFEVVKYATKDWKERRKLMLWLRMTACGGEMAAGVEELGDVFGASDRELKARLDDVMHATSGAMFLSLMDCSTPEIAVLFAEDRSRVEAAMAEIFPLLAERERVMIVRHYVQGETLRHIFESMDEPDYNAAWKRFFKVVARVGRELKERGIGPETARALLAVKIAPD